MGEYYTDEEVVQATKGYDEDKECVAQAVGPYVYYTAIVSHRNTTVEIKTSDEAELAELVHRSLEFMKEGE